MAGKTVEERLAALEAAIVDLQQRLEAPASMKDWLASIGTVTDLESFAEITRLGREFREADHPLDQEEPAA